jgi:CDP-glucose 4,6-dehydratase
MTALLVNAEFWRGRRVLITGHTGFKGGWLCLWLQKLGAQLQGLALEPPTEPSLFAHARIGDGMSSTIGDIRDLEVVRSCMASFRPEILIHVAAQSLVRESYVDPVSTYGTNVMGTVHVLEAAREVGSARAIVVVTSDKCYENREWEWGYRENEPMGGFDPYSNSKGCAELVTSSYRRSFLQDAGIALASARAGNVIGGGDWAADRLVPDILRAFEREESVRIRNPGSIRPWQHVLEPLSGYLALAEKLFAEGRVWAEGWNFGPRDEDARPVSWIVESMVRRWGGGASWSMEEGKHPHEAHHLKLDISKARSRLGWAPRWTLERALERTVDWHRAWLSGADMREQCLAQIAEYTKLVTKDLA